MNTEGYKTAQEFAEECNLTPRRVRDFCAEGRIPGAIRQGSTWLIPPDAERPVDGRTLRTRAPASPSAPRSFHAPGVPMKLAANRNMMAYCPEIKVLDASLRDGGLCNNFRFTDEFVRSLYHANIAAGIDCMEFGYKASKKMFNPEEFGKWKFCDEDSLRAIVGDNDSSMRIAVMADAGRTDPADILPKSESVIDLVRVACYIHQIPTALRMIDDAKAKGYQVSCNLMAVSQVRTEDLDAALKMMAQSAADIVYIVDSYGNYYPEQIATLACKYVDIIGAAGKEVGIHAHNNQQLAFANTIECCRWGVNYLDATVNGLGRGAGNCYSELLLGFLKNPKYNFIPLLEFVQNRILPLRAGGTLWGYDAPYMLTGLLNSHPRTAIRFLREGRTDYARYFQELNDGE